MMYLVLGNVVTAVLYMYMIILIYDIIPLYLTQCLYFQLTIVSDKSPGAQSYVDTIREAGKCDCVLLWMYCNEILMDCEMQIFDFTNTA